MSEDIMSIQSTKIGFGAGSGGLTPQSVLPYRLLVVADFLSKRRALDGSDPLPNPRRVDKDNLNAVFAELAPTVALEVPNHLGGPAPTIEHEFTFRSFDDLRPEALAAAHPGCAALLALRRQIDELARQGQSAGQIAARLEGELRGRPYGPEVLAALEPGAQGASAGAAGGDGSQPDPSAGNGGASLLDDLLEETEKNQSGKSATSGASMGSVLDSLVGGAGKKKPGSGVAAALDALDQRLGRQLDAILHDRRIAELEEAWRGLRFLVSRTDFRRDIQLEILPCAKDDLRAVLVQHVMEDEYNMPGDPPLACIIVNHAFDRTARDTNALQELTQAAERLQAPLLAEAAPQFIGVDSLNDLGAGGSLHDLLSHPEFAKWLGLRNTDPSRWLAICMNRFLLRRPWGEEETRVKGFNYREQTNEAKGENLCWGNAVWAVASRITDSFAREGWPQFISGARAEGLLEDLPLRKWEPKPGRGVQITLETGLSEMHAQDLATAGILSLQCAANKDAAYITYVPTAHLAKRYPDLGQTQDAALKAILPYQLYAGRVALALMRFLGEVGGGDPDSAQQALKQRLLDLLSTSKGAAPDHCVNVAVADNPDDPMRYLATIEIRPPFKLLNMTPRLELTVPLAK